MQSIRYPSPFLFNIMIYFLVSSTLNSLVASPEAPHSLRSHMILNVCKLMFTEGIYLEVWMGYLWWWTEERIFNTKTLFEHFPSTLCFGIRRTKYILKKVTSMNLIFIVTFEFHLRPCRRYNPINSIHTRMFPNIINSKISPIFIYIYLHDPTKP